MFIDITPTPKPRMTQQDKWKLRPAVVRYRAFCDELQQKYPNELPEKIKLKFHMPMPPSWPDGRRNRYRDTPHQNRPDIDNLIKAVMDALCKDDSYIYEVRAEKWWTDKPGIEIDSLV